MSATATMTIATNRTQVDLIHRRHLLEQRLIDGWKRIDTAVAEGRDVAAWEEFWVTLLGEYEHLCDAIREAA